MSVKKYSNGVLDYTEVPALITGAASSSAKFRSGFYFLEEMAMEAPGWMVAGSVRDAGDCVVQRITFRGE